MAISVFKNKKKKQTKLCIPPETAGKCNHLFSSWPGWLPRLGLQRLVLVSGSILSQFLPFLGYCFFIHDVCPMPSRDAIAQSYLNQVQASNVQPNRACPASSGETSAPLELSWHIQGPQPWPLPSHDESSCPSARNDHCLLPAGRFSEWPAEEAEILRDQWSRGKKEGKGWETGMALRARVPSELPNVQSFKYPLDSS